MARFFQGLDSEEKQVRQKTARLSSHGAGEEHSEEGSKLEGIVERVDGVLESGSSFAKLAKRLLADLKRCTKSMEGGQLPPRLQALFNDERFKRSSQLRAQAAEILKNFVGASVPGEEEEEAVSRSEEADGQVAVKERQTELDGILSIISDEEKEDRLLRYMQGDVPDDERCAIALVLFSIYSRRGSSDRMLWVFEEFSGCLGSSDCKHARRFRDAVDSYVARIYDCLQPGEYGRYEEALGLVSSFKSDAAEYRLLQLQFFRLSLNPATEHPRFKLLHYVRQDDWERASELYHAHGYSLSELGVLLEFADLAILKQEFSIAFDVLSYCRAQGAHHLTAKIYALCVILNGEVADAPVFTAFLDAFKAFDQNSLLLKSQDPIEEIFRAFYLLHMLDHRTAAKIIHDVCGLECGEALRSSAVRMAEHA